MDWESKRKYLFILVRVCIKCLTICMPNMTWLCISTCASSVCISRTKKKIREELHVLIASISLWLCCCWNGHFGTLRPLQWFLIIITMPVQRNMWSCNELVFSHLLGKTTMWLPDLLTLRNKGNNRNMQL